MIARLIDCFIIGWFALKKTPALLKVSAAYGTERQCWTKRKGREERAREKQGRSFVCVLVFDRD